MEDERIKAENKMKDAKAFALGINAKANDHSCNTYKKGLGRLHIAVGNGLVYNQDVNSNIHIDLIMHNPTVEIDGRVIVRDGVSTQDD